MLNFISYMNTAYQIVFVQARKKKKPLLFLISMNAKAGYKPLSVHLTASIFFVQMHIKSSIYIRHAENSCQELIWFSIFSVFGLYRQRFRKTSNGFWYWLFTTRWEIQSIQEDAFRNCRNTVFDPSFYFLDSKHHFARPHIWGTRGHP